VGWIQLAIGRVLVFFNGCNNPNWGLIKAGEILGWLFYYQRFHDVPLELGCFDVVLLNVEFIPVILWQSVFYAYWTLTVQIWVVHTYFRFVN
jgi:hypothetical protein